MKKCEDIFREKDLPQKLRGTLQNNKRKKQQCWKILSLFEVKEILTLDEILVGMYNKYGSVIDRVSATVSLGRLKGLFQHSYEERRGEYTDGPGDVYIHEFKKWRYRLISFDGVSSEEAEKRRKGEK